jgi:hypothetical protein
MQMTSREIRRTRPSSQGTSFVLRTPSPCEAEETKVCEFQMVGKASRDIPQLGNQARRRAWRQKFFQYDMGVSALHPQFMS